MDAEEEDKEVVNTRSAWRAPQVDVSRSVTSLSGNAIVSLAIMLWE